MSYVIAVLSSRRHRSVCLYVRSVGLGLGLFGTCGHILGPPLV